MLSLHAQLGTEPRTRLNSAVKLEKHKILEVTCHEVTNLLQLLFSKLLINVEIFYFPVILPLHSLHSLQLP